MLDFLWEPAVENYTVPITFKADNIPYGSALYLCFKPQPFSHSVDSGWIKLHIRDLTGTVVDENDMPQPVVTVCIKGTSKCAVTDSNGEFVLVKAALEPVIQFSAVNLETFELQVKGRANLSRIILKTKVTELSDIDVTVSNGYQTLSLTRTSGSFTNFDKKLLNRSPSSDWLTRIESISPGVMLTKNYLPNTNQTPISIRGRSTIFANPVPLIVVDQFPFYGDINSINPNDIETLSILKDAAATSIYGAASGNGVIVITTKRGKYFTPSKLSLNTNFSFRQKQDLRYMPRLNTPSYIGVENYLFNNGYYDGLLGSGISSVSPVVDILNKQKNGQLSGNEAERLMQELMLYDVRDDYERYFYSNGNAQQIALNLSGGSANTAYNISVGYDKQVPGQQKAWTDRKTFQLRLDNRPLRRVELTAITNICFLGAHNNNPLPFVKYPYERLANSQGIPLRAITNLSQALKDSIGSPLANWDFVPLDELNLTDNFFGGFQIRFSIGAKIEINKNLQVALGYQLYKQYSRREDLHPSQSFFARDLVNTFTEIRPNGITQNIPPGGVMAWQKNETQVHNGRAQINYNYTRDPQMRINAIGGIEIRELKTNNHEGIHYGYQHGQSSGLIDYRSTFPLSYNPFERRHIPGAPLYNSTIDRYFSLYANGSFTFSRRYTIDIGGRKDQSNMFGVGTNQNGVFLWYAGMSWNISAERFYKALLLPYLKLRANFGYNGNVDNTISAFTTAIDNPVNRYGVISSSIVSPRNRNLRWEKSGMLNIGIDFATKGTRIEGSIEFYKRNGFDLIGDTYIDPTAGATFYKANTAKLNGYGFDVNLTARITNRQFKWTTDFIFSHNIDRIEKFDEPKKEASQFTDQSQLTPWPGRSVYSIVGYAWKGLDPLSGDPQGFLNGIVSKDYPGIIALPPDSLRYVGHASPTVFGSIRNTFRYKGFEFSFLISVKGGYYFRKFHSFNDDISYVFNMHQKDYDKRWQKQGDEKTTTIPSLRYPQSLNRNLFYLGSLATVERGDQLRLQDIRISYDLSAILKPLRLAQTVILYMYANNIGLLWAATDSEFDPDYYLTAPSGRTMTVGLNVEF